MPQPRVNRVRRQLGLEERIALSAPTRRLRFALALEELERYAGTRPLRVLDAGCGDGLLSLAIAQRHHSWEVVGVDVLSEAISTARRRAQQRGLGNVRFVHGDLLDPRSERNFDAVLAIECLTEIPHDQGALRTMTAALRQGGILIAHVPERSWAPILPGSAPIWRHEVRHGYSAEEFAAALRNAGVTAVRVLPTLQGTVALAQELRDRIINRSLVLRALAFPAMVAAVRLERLGVTWGPHRAMLATGLRTTSSSAAG